MFSGADKVAQSDGIGSEQKGRTMGDSFEVFFFPKKKGLRNGIGGGGTKRSFS